MKRLVAILTGCMLLTSAFASCGSSSGGTDNSDAASSAASSEKTEKTTEAEDGKDEDDDEPATKGISLREKTTRERTPREDPDEEETEPETDYEPDTSSSDFIGKWELVMIEDEGITYSDSYNGISLRSAIRAEFQSDGSGQFISAADGDVLDFDWKDTGTKKITILDEDGDSSYCTLKSGYLVTDLGDPDFVLYFEKVNKYTPWDESGGDDSSGGSSSSGDIGEEIVGEWHLSKIDSNGSFIEDEYDGVDLSELMALEINADGKGTFSSYTDGENDSIGFMWEVTGPNEVTMTDDEGGTNLSYLDGEYLVLYEEDDEEFKLYFEK